AVAEDHARGPVPVVQVTGEQLGANHQYVFGLAGLDKLLRHGRPEKKPRTRRRQIKSAARRRTQPPLDESRSRGKWHVRGDGRADDQVQLQGSKPRHIEGVPGSLDGKGGRGLVWTRLAALLD